jgi:hypothetical protein
MKSKRINLQHVGTVDETVRINGLRLEVRKGERVPMLRVVPLRDGKPMPGAMTIPATDLEELSQSIDAINEELAQTSWDSIQEEGRWEKL